MSSGQSKSWQELGDEFHSMVGVCITEWANVDNELFRIFQKCVGPYDQCAIIYYRTPGLDARLNLTDEIVLSVLPPKDRESGGHDHPDVKAWKTAREGFTQLLSIRRRIAHHPVQIRTESVASGSVLGAGVVGQIVFGQPSTPPPSWFELYESAHEGRRGRGGPKPPLRLEDLAEHLTEVVHLRDRLYLFYYEVLARDHGRAPLPTDEPE